MYLWHSPLCYHRMPSDFLLSLRTLPKILKLHAKIYLWAKKLPFIIIAAQVLCKKRTRPSTGNHQPIKLFKLIIWAGLNILGRELQRTQQLEGQKPIRVCCPLPSIIFPSSVRQSFRCDLNLQVYDALNFNYSSYTRGNNCYIVPKQSLCLICILFRLWWEVNVLIFLNPNPPSNQWLAVN